MNKIFLKVALPLLFCWIVANWLITPERYNATENRYLASLPAFSADKLLDGSYEKEWETYAEDRIAGRDFWTSFHGSVEYALGKREINGVLVAQDSLMDRLEEPDSLTVANNIRGIQAYIQKYPQQRCFLMLIPSASAVQTQKLPAFATLWNQWQWIESTEKQLADCLTAVNLQNALSSHSGEYIYYRTDHHWTTLGAYYAYRELAQAMGLPVRELAGVSGRRGLI